MNKSLVTNLVSLACAVFGLVIDESHVIAIGLFATSGAVTNWLAIFMLFERVPGLYGSGVIPSRFEEFKAGIRTLVMGQFFTRDNVERFFSSGGHATFQIDGDTLSAAVDYDIVWQNLVATVKESSFGGMLGLVGGISALDPLREPFVKKMTKVVHDIAESEEFRDALAEGLTDHRTVDTVVERVSGIVDGRLEELTPQMVKEIIQEMIRKHLGWLVVWGGVFGGLIGLVTSLF